MPHGANRKIYKTMIDDNRQIFFINYLSSRTAIDRRPTSHSSAPRRVRQSFGWRASRQTARKFAKSCLMQAIVTGTDGRDNCTKCLGRSY